MEILLLHEAVILKLYGEFFVKSAFGNAITFSTLLVR